MLNLSELVFKVNTTELVEAASKALALGKAVEDLSGSFNKLSKTSGDATKAQAKVEKDLAAAEASKAKANKDNAQAEAIKNKAVKETTKATEEATKATKAQTSILERQIAIRDYVAAGYTKMQASTLQMAKAAGVAVDEIEEIGKVMKSTASLIGGDPFDKSNNALESLKNQFRSLKEVQRLYTAEIPLTRKQMDGMAQDKLRLVTIMKEQGASFGQIKVALKDLNQEYIKTANGVNRLTAAEEEANRAKQDAVNANKFLEKEMQRVNYALQAQNNELNKGTANALNRFEENLKRSGLTLDQQRVKLEAYRKGLLSLEKTKGGNTDYITRALGPQITDIFVGLATGQAPLTVMLQQGGQLRDQFALAGVAAADMGATMRTAAKDMVVSVAAVAKAFGDLLLGAFIDTGKGIVSLIGRVTGLTAALELARYQLTLLAMSDSAFGGPLLKMFNMLRVAVIGFAAAAAATGVAAVIALAVGFSQVVAENNKLAASLALSGGSLAVSHNTAIDYVRTLGDMGVTTGTATEALVAMAKAGVFSRDEILLVGKAAAEMATYADIAVEDTVKAFAKLKEKPVEALIDIAKSTGMVSIETLKMVQELQKAGKETEAAALAMQTYGDVSKQQVDQMKANYNGFSLYVMELGRTIRQFFSDIFKDLFLVSTEGMQKNLDKVQKQIDQLEATSGVERFVLGADGRLDTLYAQRDALNANISSMKLNNAALEEQMKVNTENAKNLEVVDKVMKDVNSTIDKSSVKTLTLTEYTKKYIEENKKLLRSNGKFNDDQIAQMEKAAKIEWESAQKKTKKDPSGNYYATLMREATNNTIAATNATEELTKSELKLLEVKADPRFTTLNAVQKQDVTGKYEAAVAAEKQARAVDDVAKAEEFRLKILGKSEGITKEYYGQIKALEEHAVKAGWSREQIEELTRAIFQGTPAWQQYQKALDDVNSSADKFNEMSINSQAESAQYNKELNYRVDMLGKTSEQQKAITIEYQRANKLRDVDIKLSKQLKDINDEINKAKLKGLKPEDYKSLTDAQVQAERDAAEERKTINREVAVQAAEDFDAEFRKIKEGITDSIVTALFEGGKAGSKKLRDVLVNVLRQRVTMVVDVGVNAFMNSMMGGFFGGGGAGAGGAGGAMSMLSNGFSLYNAGSQALTLGSQYLGGTMSGANALGTMFANGTGTGISGLLSTNAGYGTMYSAANAAMPAAAPGMGAGAGGSTLGAAGTAAGVAAVAAIVLNALGAFKTEKKIGSGLTGTLGGGQLSPWEEWREGGSLFSGPSFSSHNPLEELSKQQAKLDKLREAGQGASQQAAVLQTIINNLTENTKGLAESTKTQSNAIQKGFTDLRSGVVKMANSLGLAGDSVKTFTYDLAQQDLNFDGLKPEEIQAKIQAVFDKAGNSMAEQLLGKYETYTETVTKTLVDGVLTDASEPIYSEFSDVLTKTRYIAGEFSKDGETAIQTLTRLSNSFLAVNNASEALGFGLYDASLEMANFADGIVEAFGGLEKFLANTNSFIQNYYSDAERRSALAGQGSRALSDLGIDVSADQLLGSSKDQVRELVNSLKGDPKLYAEVMNIANNLVGLFETAAEVSTVSNNDLETSTNDALKASIDLEKTRLGLMKQIYTLEEDDVKLKETIQALRTLELAQMDGSLRGLQEHLWALEDANAEMQKYNSLRDESVKLEVERLRILGFEEEALAMERTIAVKGMNDQQKAMWDANKTASQLNATLREQQAAMERIKSLLPQVFEQFMSPEAFKKYQYEDVAKKLISAGIFNVDLQTATNELMNATKQQIADVGSLIWNTVDLSAAQREALLESVSTLGTLKDASIEAANAITDAFKNVGDDIVAYIRELATGRAGLATPTELLAKTREVYNKDFAAAQGGDIEAAQRLVDSARAYIDAQKEVTASSSITDSVIKAIMQQLSGLGFVQDQMAGMHIPQYANGGVFSNSIVTSPTRFNIGEMGEDGAEAIMPLVRTSSGSLGVSSDNSQTNELLQLLITEIQDLKAQQSAETNAQITVAVSNVETLANNIASALDKQGWKETNKPKIN